MNAILPAMIGPITVEIDNVELNMPVDVERGLFSIRWKFPPINKNAHVAPTNDMNGIAIHHSVTNDNPIKTKVVHPIPILNFVTFERWILLAITFIKINAVSVLATYTIEIWYKSPPHLSTIIIGRIVHTAAAPICLSSNDKNRNLFFKITNFVVPGSISFFCLGFGSFIVKIKPMIIFEWIHAEKIEIELLLNKLKKLNYEFLKLGRDLICFQRGYIFS